MPVISDVYPDYTTKTPPIGDLQAFYKESKKRFDEESEFKIRAYESVVKLQSHEENYMKAWTLICDASRKEFQKIYDRLGIKNLEERGESYYQDRMNQLVAMLKEKGMLEDDEGRLVMFGDGDEVIPYTNFVEKK